MKKINYLVLALALLVVGCTPNMRRQALTAKYPDSEVLPIPGDGQSIFLVRKSDGSVWFVYCGNPFRSNPTSESLAFKATK